jgi:hypothetical protein
MNKGSTLPSKGAFHHGGSLHRVLGETVLTYPTNGRGIVPIHVVDVVNDMIQYKRFING